MNDEIHLPYTDGCFVCGVKNDHGLKLKFTYSDGEVHARYTPPEEKCGYPGIVHGGILSTMLDEVMAWAPCYEKKLMCVAAELKVRFLKPAHVGTPLLIRGHLAKDKRLFWLCEGSIEDPQGKILVTAKGTYVPLSGEESERIENKALIYPDGTNKIFSR